MSGDGLIHEVVNGLLIRNDWQEFKETITIGCLPGGTSNGLVKSLLDHIDEDYSILNAAFRIARGNRKLMDVTELSLEYEKKRVYAILGVTWAVISDIDINSEVIRCCGSPRLTVWGVFRSICKKHYPGSFNFRGKHIRNRNETDFEEA